MSRAGFKLRTQEGGVGGVSAESRSHRVWPHWCQLLTPTRIAKIFTVLEEQIKIRNEASAEETKAMLDGDGNVKMVCNRCHHRCRPCPAGCVPEHLGKPNLAPISPQYRPQSGRQTSVGGDAAGDDGV